MIPLESQENLRQYFARALTSRVRIDLFSQKKSQVIVPGLEECRFCEDAEALIGEIAALNPRISLTRHDVRLNPSTASDFGIDKVPATVIRGQANRPLRFFGMPTGAMFSTFVETIGEVCRSKVELEPQTIGKLRKIRDQVKLQVFVLPSCAHSPAVVRTAFRFALQNARIETDAIELSEFQALGQRYGVRATPTVVINDSAFLAGSINEATLADAIARVLEGRPIATLPTGPATALRTEKPPEPRTSPSGLIIPGR